MRCYLLATEEGFEEATESTRAVWQGQGATAWDADVAGVGCGGQTLPTTLAHTLPHTALFLGSSAPKIIVKFSGCLGRPHSPPRLQNTPGALILQLW